LIKAELVLEAELLRRNPLAHSILRATRRTSNKIAFISDSYLPEWFVHQALDVLKLTQQGEPVYVSCERSGATKVSSELFSRVLADQGVTSRSTLHIGNHPVADIAAPRRLGIRVAPLSEGNLNRYECALEEYSFATSGLASVMAGASRLARLGRAAVRPDLQVVDAVVAGVVAPMLTSFTLAVLLRARRQGIRRLYFLAREGQVLFEIASKLVGTLSIEIDLRYLYVSRQSLNAASVDTIDEAHLGWALTHAETNTLRTILARLGASPSSLRDALTDAGFPEQSWDSVLTQDRMEAFVQEILCGEMQVEVERALTNKRKMAVRYLEQEGVFDDIPIGLVDTSGVGSQQRTIGLLRQRRSLMPPRSFLIFRQRPAETLNFDDDPCIFGWYHDQAAGFGYGAPPGHAALIEVFCRADHGTVLDYAHDGNNVVPVFASTRESDTQLYLQEEVRCTLERFRENLVLDGILVDIRADMRPAVTRVLYLFWSSPTRSEVLAWGTVPFEGASGDEHATVALARPYRIADVLVALMHGRLESRSWFEWRAGCLTLSDPVTRNTIIIARFGKATLIRVRRSLTSALRLRQMSAIATSWVTQLSRRIL
jgi:hypothetical protein